jgi:hypothetical protein
MSRKSQETNHFSSVRIGKKFKKYETYYNSDINTGLNHHLFIILSYKHIKVENLQARVQ